MDLGSEPLKHAAPDGSLKLPFLAAAASLLPFLIWFPKFKLLYWFHDDWELLNQWTILGPAAWIRQPMGENFSPVFKLLWIGAVHLTGGSYLQMVALLWTTHLAILMLLAMVLTRCDFSPEASAIAVLLAGLSWTNIETLGWATQWSALLCTLFLMIAWAAVAAGNGRWPAFVAVAAILLGGATFARGILSGAVLALFLLLSGRKKVLASLLLLCAFLLLIPYGHFMTANPNFQRIDAARIAAMARWGRDYLLLNPLYLLVSYPGKQPDETALWIFGGSKIAIMSVAMFIARPLERPLLWTLLFFDVATAGLLAFARFETGVSAEVSSRYQWIPLLCLGPFLGLLMVRAVRSQPLSIALGMVLAFAIALPWGRHLERWSYERGIEVRRAIAATPDDQRFGLPSITAGRARELIAKYGLH